MAQQHYNALFKKALLQFITEPDPFLAILKWVMTEMMMIQIEEKGRFAAHLKQIWLEPDKESARRAAAALIDDYEKRFPEAVRCLEEGLEDSLSFYDFPDVDKKRISSTNGQEQLNMEIRRRSRVVGVFPSVPSFLRLTICYLIEHTEDWENERSYIREDKAQGSLDRLHELMAQTAN